MHLINLGMTLLIIFLPMEDRRKGEGHAFGFVTEPTRLQLKNRLLILQQQMSLRTSKLLDGYNALKISPLSMLTFYL